MKKATYRTIVLFAVAAIGVWAWLWLSDVEAPPHKTTPPTAEPTPPVAAASDRVTDRRTRRAAAPEGPPDPAAADDTPEARPKAVQRILRILDDEGRPVTGVRVRVRGADLRTDARGEAAFDATDSTCVVRFDDRDVERVVELREAVTEARLAGMPVMAVDVVDGVTGASLAGVEWRTRVREGEWIDGGAAPRLVVGRGEFGPIDVEVDAPDGSGAFGPLRWRPEIAGRARRARITVSAYPLHEVLLRVVDSEGRPVEGAIVIDAVNYEPFPWKTSWRPARISKSDDEGLLAMAMPRLPFGRVTVQVARHREAGNSSGDELRGSTDGVRLDAPDDAAPTKVVLYPVQAQGLTAGDPTSRRKVRDGPTASLVVRAAYRDGAPAPGVIVRAGSIDGTTGADGSTKLEDVPVGRCDVVAFEHGFLASAVAADVGHDAEVLIREAASRAVRVQVVDETGAARPGAMVWVVCVRVPGAVAVEVAALCSVAQIDGDEERLDPTTGRDGAIELVAPAGTIEYRATLGDAVGKTESSADVVRVVLVPPKE